jgi:hypothetical protein
MFKRKRKLKEIEKISYAVSYALTTEFVEKHDRIPNEYEINLIQLKGTKYVLEILDNIEQGKHK